MNDIEGEGIFKNLVGENQVLEGKYSKNSY